MPRNVAQSTKSCAARINTEPSITPCGGIAIPTAAKRINLVVPVVCHFVTSAVAPVLPVVIVVSVVFK